MTLLLLLDIGRFACSAQAWFLLEEIRVRSRVICGNKANIWILPFKRYLIIEPTSFDLQFADIVIKDVGS